MLPMHGQLVGFALGQFSFVRSSFIVSSSVLERQNAPEERLAIGMAVMSLGLWHLHLLSGFGAGQVREDARSAADAAPQVPAIMLHLHEVHLAQSILVFPLVLHLVSIKVEALPFCAH